MLCQHAALVLELSVNVDLDIVYDQSLVNKVNYMATNWCMWLHNTVFTSGLNQMIRIATTRKRTKIESKSHRNAGKARFRYILCLSLLRIARTPLIVYKGVTGRQRCKTMMVIRCWTYLLIKIGLVLEDYGTHK